MAKEREEETQNRTERYKYNRDSATPRTKPIPDGEITQGGFQDALKRASQKIPSDEEKNEK